MLWPNYRTIHKLITLFFVLLILTVVPVNLVAGATGVSKFQTKIMKSPIDKLANRYDEYYKKYSKYYFSIVFDWNWFKAQAQAESGQNPSAVSPVGAAGVLQLMPKTMDWIVKRDPSIVNDRFTARWNINAGIYYDSYLYKQWSSPRPDLDRIALMLASYNAGIGNILKAQKICKGSSCNLWGPIKSKGSLVSTWKESETINYVTKIFKFMGYEGY